MSLMSIILFTFLNRYINTFITIHMKKYYTVVGILPLVPRKTGGFITLWERKGYSLYFRETVWDVNAQHRVLNRESNFTSLRVVQARKAVGLLRRWSSGITAAVVAESRREVHYDCYKM